MKAIAALLLMLLASSLPSLATSYDMTGTIPVYDVWTIDLKIASGKIWGGRLHFLRVEPDGTVLADYSTNCIHRCKAKPGQEFSMQIDGKSANIACSLVKADPKSQVIVVEYVARYRDATPEEILALRKSIRERALHQK